MCFVFLVPSSLVLRARIHTTLPPFLPPYPQEGRQCLVVFLAHNLVCIRQHEINAVLLEGGREGGREEGREGGRVRIRNGRGRENKKEGGRERTREGERGEGRTKGREGWREGRREGLVTLSPSHPWRSAAQSN